MAKLKSSSSSETQDSMDCGAENNSVDHDLLMDFAESAHSGQRYDFLVISCATNSSFGQI